MGNYITGRFFNTAGILFKKIGDIDQAMKHFKIGANKGYKISMYELGYLYSDKFFDQTEDDLVKIYEDFEHAMTWLKRSKHVDAQLLMDDLIDTIDVMNDMRHDHEGSSGGAYETSTYETTWTGHR